MKIPNFPQSCTLLSVNCSLYFIRTTITLPYAAGILARVILIKLRLLHEIRAENDNLFQRNAFINRTQQYPLLPKRCISTPTSRYKIVC